MTNYSAKILNNATGSLAAQQAVIAATSNNIANVNTPGYSRRVVELQTRTSRTEGSGVNVGSGVEVGRLNRLTDSFLQRLVRESGGDQAYYQVQSDLLKRVDAMFSLTGDQPTIGSALTSFFGAVDDLTADPSSITLRAAVIDKGNDLVSIIKTTYNTIASVQDEANQRVGNEIQSVNSLTAQIAEMNNRIRANERTGNVDADDRDQRDVLLEGLSKKLDVNVLELPDGTVNVSLANGFALVTGGESRDLGFTSSPSFSTSPNPTGLSGSNLGFIVYDYSGGSGVPAHIDLTSVIGNGGGSIGGLLALRGIDSPSNTSAFQVDGTLVQAASRVEAITRQLLTAINRSYLGPDQDPAPNYQPSAADLDGHTATFYNATDHAYNLFTFQSSGTKDADGNGLPDDLDSLSIDNYSSRLQFAVTDPRRLAAALNSGTFGVPVYAPGDGRNMEALSALKDASYTFSKGSFSTTGTFGDAYAEAVGFIGNTTEGVTTQASVAAQALTTAQNSRDEVSGVSLDEEFSSLIKFQKAYQASAKMMKVADTMLDTIVGLI